LHVLILICTTLLFVIPGLLIIALLYEGRSWQEIFLRGPSVGFAAAIFLAFALSYIDLALFWFTWASISLALLVSVGRRQLRRPSLASLDVHTGWLIILLCLVMVTRLAPAHWQLMPPGWDSSFHLLLAKKILLTHGMIFDWQPFETSRLNYPVGGHVLLAQFALLTGLPIHTVFKFLIPLFGVITTAQIYFYALRISSRREIALYSATAYGLLAVMGSIDYYRWGGLPNLVGMSFLLECLIVTTEQKPTHKDSVLLGVIFTALFFTHHHVMVTAGVVLAALFGYYVFLGGERQRAKIIFEGLLISLIIGSFYIVPYVLRASTLGSTSVLTFHEMYYSVEFIFDSLGYGFSAMAVLGVAAYTARSLLDAEERKFHPSFLVAAGTIAILFIAFGYVYRGISLALFGLDYVAFTPSRFLTDLVYFLAVFAGYAAWLVQRCLPMRASVGASVAMVSLFLLAYTNHDAWHQLYEPNMSQDSYLALDWISKNTPEKTIILNNNSFAAYVSWRRTLSSPMPISEPQPQSARLSSAEIARLRFSGDDSVEARAWELVAIEPKSAMVAGNEILWQSPNSDTVILRMPAR
jgi:hypothetical protein